LLLQGGELPSSAVHGVRLRQRRRLASLPGARPCAAEPRAASALDGPSAAVGKRGNARDGPSAARQRPRRAVGGAGTPAPAPGVAAG